MTDQDLAGAIAALDKRLDILERYGRLPVYTSTTARDSAIPIPVAGSTIYLDTNSDDEGVYVYTGTAWINANTARYGAHVYRSTTQSITNSTVTAISFDTEPYDPFGFWVIGTPTKLTVPAGGAGLYVVRVYTLWDTVSNVIQPQIGVHVINAGATNTQHERGDITALTSNQGPAFQTGLTMITPLAVGDQLEPWVYHPSAAARNIGGAADANTQANPFLRMYRIGL